MELQLDSQAARHMLVCPVTRCLTAIITPWYHAQLFVQELTRLWITCDVQHNSFIYSAVVSAATLHWCALVLVLAKHALHISARCTVTAHQQGLLQGKVILTNHLQVHRQAMISST